jgi:hypothetical protein
MEMVFWNAALVKMAQPYGCANNKWWGFRKSPYLAG